MKAAKKIIQGLLLGSAIITLNSCIFATVGSDTAAYLNGEYSMNMKGSVKNIYEVAIETLNDDNDFILVSKDLNLKENTSEIEGATKINSTDFTINIKKATSNSSKITIKFGTGDQIMSSSLMDQIQANLNKSSANKTTKCSKK